MPVRVVEIKSNLHHLCSPGRLRPQVLQAHLIVPLSRGPPHFLEVARAARRNIAARTAIATLASWDNMFAVQFVGSGFVSCRPTAICARGIVRLLLIKLSGKCSSSSGAPRRTLRQLLKRCEGPWVEDRGTRKEYKGWQELSQPGVGRLARN
jgi:hypothetical protein